ncbi:hypothetical protein [Rhodococcoides fascians]|uniref:hypothetical protein n=1 Tax=Rhodococcoides fascians TaxID=1828 RepID=UPI0012D2F308|nr:hypothetical protein [Rhodococcus fascians]
MRIFLTSDSDPGRIPLRGILAERGDIVQEPGELGAGALVSTTDWTADAVIAAIFDGDPSQERRESILVEVGVAIGRGIPTLILSRPGLQLPSLVGLPRIDADPEDADTLALKIDLFLQGVLKHSPRKSPMFTGAAAGPVSKASISLLAGLELEQAVGQLLQAAGAEFIREARVNSVNGGDRAESIEIADFALYIPGHETDLGLVLVEVKSVANAVDPKRRLRTAAQRLSGYAMRGSAALGLLVYDGKPVRTSSAPLTACLSIGELAGQLESAPLATVLRRARNKAIHGM